ncbi:hypothetical protein JTE90_026674, partial [Oedothorax gibbosus]
MEVLLSSHIVDQAGGYGMRGATACNVETRPPPIPSTLVAEFHSLPLQEARQ